MMLGHQSESVKVVVRCRPINQRERDMHSKIVVFMDSPSCQCSIVNPNDASAPPKTFSFDGVYYMESTTDSLYSEIAFPLVEGCLEGFNATVFAYGQTGCGKSFTMQGIADSACQKGIIPRAFEHVFENIETSENIKFLVHASYLEIYNEEIRDLLGKDVKRKLDLKENPDKGVYVSDISQHAVHNVEECEALMEKGWRNRAVGATLMNADSSRSHSIFTINIEMMSEEDGGIRKGKLNLVDLAGSERQAKTGATGDRLKEATKINLSLSALGNVISALVDGKSKHIPYRDSKLTRLLQDSLGGNTKTLMVACISPADNNYDETLSTLRYANRAKNIKNKPRINQDPKDALLSQYQDEIRQLREMLERQQQQQLPPPNLMITDLQNGNSEKLEAEKEKIRQEYEQQLQQLRKNFEMERQDNARLQADVENLRKNYERELSEVKTLEQQQNGHLLAPPGPGGGRRGSVVALTPSTETLSAEQQEALQRLQEIQENMVGGEKAHDKELKEKLAKKKKAAERRTKQVENKSDDEDGHLLRAYDNIQEELRAKTEGLKKCKMKIRSLEREISDLYSEFQNDRTDYLETIRRQDQSLKLLQAILDKIQPTIRKDCNYGNIDAIKADAVWSDESQRWKIPELLTLKTKLPPAGFGGVSPGKNGVNGTNFNGFTPVGNTSSLNNRVPSKTAPAILSSEDDYGNSGLNSINDNNNSNNKSDSILFRKFENSDKDDFTENYFKPKRSTDVLLRAQQDANRVQSLAQVKSYSHAGSNSNIFSSWNNGNNNLNNSGFGGGNVLGGGLRGNKIQSNSWGPSPVQNGWGSAGSSMNGFLSSPEIGAVRRPTKLDALPIDPTSKAFKKLSKDFSAKEF